MTTIRRATLDDLDAVCRIAKVVGDAHHAAHPDVFAPPGDAARDADHWRRAIDGPGAACFVPVVDGSVVGYVAVHCQDDTHTLLAGARVARVQSIGVDAAHRSQGIGRRLMAAAEAWAVERGATDFRLQVWTFNARAVALYESLGFSTQLLTMRKPLSLARRPSP